MLESRYIYEFVANKALKGFVFRDGRVVPKTELTLEDNKDISSDFHQHCGSNINKWIQNLNLNKLMENPVGQIDIADIVPGSIVKLELFHKEVIEIIYQGNFMFLVCKDTVGVLQPLDMLKALTLSFNKGDAVFFKVLRNGIAYPCDDLLFKAIICHITLINSNIEGKYSLSNKNVTTTISLDHVFAWKAEGRPARFIEAHLTESCQAIFHLNLIKHEFWINSQFSKHYYDDVPNVLKPVCNINHTGKGLQTIAPGKFSLERNDSGCMFYVKKKMEVGV